MNPNVFESVLAVLLALERNPPLPRVTVVAPKATLRLEVADTEAEREAGLMNRTAIPLHTGMIFIFKRDAPESFWMKDTLVPLDMIFVAPDGMVRRVFSDVAPARPHALDFQIPLETATAKYVIELAANEASADGIVAGARLRLGTLPAAR